VGGAIAFSLFAAIGIIFWMHRRKRMWFGRPIYLPTASGRVQEVPPIEDVPSAIRYPEEDVVDEEVRGGRLRANDT